MENEDGIAHGVPTVRRGAQIHAPVVRWARHSPSLVLRLPLVASLALLAVASAHAQGLPAWVRTDARSLTGTWAGTYECAQGPTGVVLTLRGDVEGSLTATFRFSAVPENPDVPTGRYEMAGAQYADGRVVLVGTRWTSRPPDYVMVDFDGWTDAGGDALRGTVCGYPATLRRR